MWDYDVEGPFYGEGLKMCEYEIVCPKVQILRHMLQAWYYASKTCGR